MNSTTQRLDHVSTRFILPDTSHIQTNNEYVPALFIVQLQLPKDPPPSLFTTTDDGPGWAIVVYFMITEVTLVILQMFGVNLFIIVDKLKETLMLNWSVICRILVIN